MKVYTIPGKPVAWARARQHGKIFFDAQKEEKRFYGDLIRSQMKSQGMILRPLSIDIEFYMVIPRSWTKKKQSAYLKMPHSTIPDLDNLIKFVNDALNGVLWKDDSLIYHIQATKYYSAEPRTVITLKMFEDNPLLGN